MQSSEDSPTERALPASRGLFATHYHKLADAHAGDPNVAIRHMACRVTTPADGGPEQVRLAPRF